MSHIIEFQIAGLAGRKEVYAKKLNRGVNIFFGLNGSGKTSLLKILHSAMQGSASILESVPFTSAQVKIYTIKHNSILTRSIEKKTLSSQTELWLREDVPAHTEFQSVRLREFRNRALHFQPGQMVQNFNVGSLPEWKTERIENVDEENLSGKWSHRYLPTTRLYLDSRGTVPRYASDTPSEQAEEFLDRFFAQTMSRLWLTYSAELLSQVRETQEIAIAQILRNVLATTRRTPKKSIANVDLDKAYDHVANFLKRQANPDILGSKTQFASRYREDPSLQGVVDEIDTVEKKIEDTMAPRERLQHLIRKMFTGNKSVTFADQEIQIETDEHTRIGLESLSSGEKHVLKLFIEALLAEDCSIMIDEPELSLHIDWQKELIDNFQLLNSSAQYICATHSPEIMANVDDSKIFRL
jgi:predicted ATP-dependent endonuclease of OLD family